MNLVNRIRTYVVVQRNSDPNSIYGYVITSGLAYHVLAYAVDQAHAERVIRSHGWHQVASHEEAEQQYLADQQRRQQGR